MITIYDTTLRDGTQREGISLSLADKLRVTELLDTLGVAYIEGGWPGSNPKDAAFFDAVRELTLTHAKIAAFGSTCRKQSDPSTDANIRALVDAQTPVVTVVGKTSMLHVVEVLQTTRQRKGFHIAGKFCLQVCGKQDGRIKILLLLIGGY